VIKVTRLNSTAFVLNSSMIKFIEARPDTTITLVNDEKVVIQEPVDEVIERVIDFERRVRTFKD
jgi:flagellar protein FlbD